MKRLIASLLFLLVIVLNGYPSGIFAKQEAKRFVLVSGKNNLPGTSPILDCLLLSSLSPFLMSIDLIFHDDTGKI